MLRKSFDIIVGYTKKSFGIGYENKLPWNHIKEDMKRFAKITSTVSDSTKQNSVIMGRNTWRSLPDNSRPLPNRHNIIISKSLYVDDGTTKTFPCLNSALDYSYNNPLIEKSFVIGGGMVYDEAIKRMDLDEIHSTVIDRDCEADTFFPSMPKWLWKTGNEVSTISPDISFETWKNMSDPDSEEYAYLDSMRRILDEGEHITDRTGVGTISLFDENFKFSVTTINPDEPDQTKLSYRVPILTTKNLYLKGVIWELIWFLNGNTDSKWLSERDVHIWDGHTSAEYLKMKGLDYEEGELGPGYGHQWVNWGGDYKSRTGGVNQIQNVIKILKDNPESRRAILSAWNVGDLEQMALPPCHVMYIFKVSDHDKERKTLNCKVILRSNDMFLGNPFNIMSTVTLTILLSRALNMLPGKIAISIGDAHIYKNHIEQVMKQLKRVPLKFPLMSLEKEINSYDDMKNLIADDFVLDEYYKWPGIKAPMAI
mgnify:CR=1 FL=1